MRRFMCVLVLVVKTLAENWPISISYIMISSYTENDRMVRKA